MISSAKNGVPAALSAIVRPSSRTEGSGPSNSETSAAVSRSLSGERAMDCAPGTCASAPRYSGRWVISVSRCVCGTTVRKSASRDSLDSSIQWASSMT